MNKEEIFRIKEHIEIHARREPYAIKITEIMWKAVAELEHLAELEKENAELKRDKEDLIFIRNQNAKCMCEDKENLAKAKEIIKEILEEDNYALLLPKEMRLKAEQFLKEIEK